MSKFDDLLKKSWFIVSYRNLSSKAVGGIRGDRLKKFLLEKGIATSLISCNSGGDDNEVEVKERIGERCFFGRAIGAFLPIDNTLFWAYKVYQKLKNHPYSVVLTTAPPFGISLVGLLLKKQKNTHFWIADFRDPWTLNVLYRPIFYPYKKRVANYLEKRIFYQADLILLNTETDLNNYLIKYPFIKQKSLVVRNGFDSFKENQADLQEKSNNIKLIYAGSAYQGGVAARAVVDFLKQANHFSSQRVVCDYYGEHHPYLQDSASITYKDNISYEAISRVLRTYRMGIIYLQEACIDSGRITQKFYDYIGCGVIPIVINPSKEMSLHMDKLNVGIKVFPKDDFRKIMTKVQAQYLSNTSLDSKLLGRYTRSHQFEKILLFIKNKMDSESNV